MNLSSILLKSIIADCDMDTWAECEQHYFPVEYHVIWKTLNSHVQNHSKLPSFEELQLSIRDGQLRDKFASLEKVEYIDIDNETLLEYLKNEFTQIEIMQQLEKYLDNTIATESAAESIEALQDIVLDVESKVDTRPRNENMQTVELISSDDDLERNIVLGLNNDYDKIQTFGKTDLILIGGRRGSGKSVTCANMAVNAYDEGKSSIYFTIEMDTQSTLQRMCSIATGVPAAAIRNGNLSLGEWQLVAEWMSSRFENGEKYFHDYLSHRDFRKLQSELSVNPLREVQLDIVYNPSLTLANIRTELDKKMKRLQPSVVIVDYINQVKRGGVSNNRMGQYDWTEQIEVSKALKTFAQEYEVPFISPYQIDASGEARFAKGILDAADAAFTLDTHNKEDNIITFNCTKMRNSEERNFTSVMDWTSLRIGPETGVIQREGDSEEDVYEEIA